MTNPNSGAPSAPVAKAATSGPTAAVPKDPQPTVDRIDELSRRIVSGDILLPKFQRDFVWERPQILTLLDSVARGYPIGSVLLWQSRQELRSENRIADLEKPDSCYSKLCCCAKSECVRVRLQCAALRRRSARGIQLTQLFVQALPSGR